MVHVLNKYTFGIMSFGIMQHSGLCSIRDYVIRDFVTFGILSLLGLCCSGLCRLVLCRIQDYVVGDYFTFRIMLHSSFHRSSCVVCVNVAWLTVVRDNVVRPNVCVSIWIILKAI